MAAGVGGLISISAPASLSAQGLDFETACAFAKRFYTLKQQVPDIYRVGVSSLSDLNNWTEEIVPLFEYEGVDAEGDVGEYGSLVYPNITFEDYQDGLRSNHVLGTTEIFSADVTLSSRFTNPVSPWYDAERSVMTLIHELAHAQGVKFPGTQFDEESSAQLVALEIAAAMVNKGNRLVVAPLLGELTSMFSSAARWLAIDAGDEARWYVFRNETYTDPFEIASFEKSDRFWAADPEHLAYIVQAYNYLPINAVYQAIEGDLEIDGVRLPINWMLDQQRVDNGDYNSSASYREPQPTATASPTALPEGEPLVVDDLAYLFDHVEELVGALQDGDQ